MIYAFKQLKNHHDTTPERKGGGRSQKKGKGPESIHLNHPKTTRIRGE